MCHRKFLILPTPRFCNVVIVIVSDAHQLSPLSRTSITTDLAATE